MLGCQRDWKRWKALQSSPKTPPSPEQTSVFRVWINTVLTAGLSLTHHCSFRAGADRNGTFSLWDPNWSPCAPNWAHWCQLVTAEQHLGMESRRTSAEEILLPWNPWYLWLLWVLMPKCFGLLHPPTPFRPAGREFYFFAPLSLNIWPQSHNLHYMNGKGASCSSALAQAGF